MGGRRHDPPPRAADVRRHLEALADPTDARQAAVYFKTGPGQYGEGDVFRGIRAARLHAAARRFEALPLPEVERLLASRFHEDRMVALLVLVRRFARGDATVRRQVFDCYVRNLDRVDSWDLVDASAHRIVGPWLEDRGRTRLEAWARSPDLWRRRVAIMATLHYIRHGEFATTLRLAALLRDDAEDLIHKAVGWMLREIGNRDRAAEERFLKRHYRRMPRTMLRYAIERFPERRRQAYLSGRV